jgi:hypothetical protein
MHESTHHSRVLFADSQAFAMDDVRIRIEAVS